jgi:uncharacterized protein YgiM (DUF1202 family)
VRAKLALILVIWIVPGLAWAGAPEFPYKAYVISDGVQVRSGPGEDYYATDRLKAGDQVEIYRHDPGGWYAIRPPVGSFSWVSGRYIDKPNRDHVATVSGQRVAARVGSRISDTRDVIQVRLQKGEAVEIVGTQSGSEGQNEGSVWYKIAPPSGEFRWIQGKYVDPDYPHDGLSKPHSTSEVRSTGVTTETSHWQAATAGTAAAEPIQPLPARGPAPGASAVPLTMRSLSPEEFQKELEDRDLELSQIVAQEPGKWYFEHLRPQVETLIVQANTALERGRARLLLTKIARFEDLRKQSDSLQTAQADVARINNQAAQVGQDRGTVLQTARGVERFDGVGRLAPVAAPNPGGPRYALVERDGAVRCYVTAAPGVNLQYYVGREVGVIGIRGYMPEQRAQHVMAKHVTTLDDNSVLR